jgi:outer membrane protein TolC
MKKIAFLYLTLTCGIGVSYAQESLISQINYNQLEKYIQAARENYPQKQRMAMLTERARYNVSQSALSYLDILNASYFYRPDQATAVNANNPYIVNGLQFGVNINLGNFLQKPYEAKKAKADLKIAELEEQEYDTYLTNEVKNRYYTYVRQSAELKLKSQSAQDSKSLTDDLRYKFEKGETTLQVYNTARISSSGADSDRIQAEIDYLKAKDALEQLIGKKLEEVN